MPLRYLRKHAAALMLATFLTGCASSAPRTDTVDMDEFRKVSQTPPTHTEKVVFRGKRGSYYYADVYKLDDSGAMKKSHEIRTKDTANEVFRQDKKGPTQMEFEQLPTGLRDPMEGSNYIDNPPPLSISR